MSKERYNHHVSHEIFSSSFLEYLAFLIWQAVATQGNTQWHSLGLGWSICIATKVTS